ncbi:NAD-P-binding protein [Vararia minispora EC-137]|uniref:NAD-P-binding protein n=1 Tax=Vararia minispora EC-137 TaxID=1314806 RepID=A0ACB8QK00_9AGAM|nr:NAD-P-binding protein [Vararia minispora EC-137]
MDLDLKGVHVLVTGGNSGIGCETTRIFLEQGATVTATYRSSSSRLLALRPKYDETRLCIVHADLTSEAAVTALFADSPTPIEIVVINHAVYAGYGPLKDMSAERWRTTLDSNLTSSFLVCRAFLRGLQAGIAAAGSEKKERGFGERAAIVFIGSTSGKFGEACGADYAACKSALMYGLTLSLKNEIVAIAPRGRVNCIAPGWVDTPAVAKVIGVPQFTYPSLATTPLKKVAQPADVAQQVVLLASAKVSGHVTGQVVMVDGGMEGRVQSRPGDLGFPPDV